MDINQIFNIILQVLKDIRVIGTVIVMILVISFAKFISQDSTLRNSSDDREGTRRAPSSERLRPPGLIRSVFDSTDSSPSPHSPTRYSRRSSHG